MEHEQTSPLAHLSVIDVADLFLLALVTRGSGTLVIEPSSGRHVVRYEHGEQTLTLVWLESSRADAVVARLAIVAGLSFGAWQNQVGRVRVRRSLDGSSSGPVTELLVVVRSMASGLGAELHRIGQPGAQSGVPLSGPAVSPVAHEDALQVGSYRLLCELGQGGMGIVYRAEHVVLQKPVAVKVLHPDVAHDPLIAAQFVVEARAACRARHPGIVDVTDFGTLSDGRSYIVMELVESPTLAALLQHGALEPARALAIACQMAAALRAASARGVVHRDLTPANVFVAEGDRVKVGDFGLARIVDQAEATGDDRQRTIMGTLAYMSPEQALGEAVDSRSDIYSLGCVLFRMLTGRVPFFGASLLDVITHHTQSPVPTMASPNGAMPEGLQGIVERAMAKSPDERYGSFDELLLDLDRAARALSGSDWRRWMPP